MNLNHLVFTIASHKLEKDTHCKNHEVNAYIILKFVQPDGTNFEKKNSNETVSFTYKREHQDPGALLSPEVSEIRQKIKIYLKYRSV